VHSVATRLGAHQELSLKFMRAHADPVARDAMPHPADHRSTRHMTLPTGPSAAVETGLHVCPECSSSLVTPVAWEQAGPHEWAVTIECPNCEWWDADVFDEATIERFDEELDRGTEALVRDLLRLTRANMEDDVERFLNALRADAILPEDF
jgi:hypothetical protein